MKVLLVLIAAFLAACASSSGIVPDGPDGYRIAGTGGTGFTKAGNMQNENYEQAAAFCAQRGKVVETVKAETTQSRPLGGFPEASLRFRCVERAE